MLSPAERIANNLAGIRQRIHEAAQRSGRRGDQITLVAVTKYVSTSIVQHLLSAGCYDLGESRPQQLWEKAAKLDAKQIRWHQIGHLQRNKLDRTLPLLSLLHSADSERLLNAISRWCVERSTTLPVLVEVNVSGDQTKHGFSPAEVAVALTKCQEMSGIEVCGLMTMAARIGGAERARRDFSSLRALRDQLQNELAPDLCLDELSMGMSGDFEAAIEEGATIVRVGSALFEGIEEK